MKNTSLTALGGIVTALSVLFMFLSSLLPFMTYVVPAFAGLLLIVTVKETDLKWSVYIYIAVSALSLLVIADKESAVMYTFFFGYYPILYKVLQDKVKNKLFKTILKFVIFNISIILGYLFTVFVFAIPIDEMEEFGKYTNLVLLALGNLTFIFYDILITNLSYMYDKLWKKQINKIFKF